MLLAVLMSLGSGAAQAEPAFARLYKQQYGYTPSCNACHKDGGGTPVNGYGQQYKDAGMTLAAFGTIAGLDGDGDGFANDAESRARANPGDARSTPDNKGDWLDTASLIPREVQAAFPGVRAYLPRDAVLTDADIARARSMGAELSRDDENTIYIPLENQRPVGTALIFPVAHGDKTFFLLMTTDRQLRITGVVPLNTNQVPAAARAELYRGYTGVALDALPAAQGEGLAADIARAVKNAGTLVYVRLKGA
ncbi:hypothetical protein [Sinimarinibacterium thermocellulolyticum]|uniref:Cytochrome c domain-containing protein n=1 Tax=Sinimarinibacterium thermocellulolyticum TaxID=3170016 RepID=A0ABV2AD91_9GAMM